MKENRATNNHEEDGSIDRHRVVFTFPPAMAVSNAGGERLLALRPRRLCIGGCCCCWRERCCCCWRGDSKFDGFLVVDGPPPNCRISAGESVAGALSGACVRGGILSD